MTQSTASDYDFTQQIGFLLRRAYQRHVSIFQQTVPESRLTAAQFVVLLIARDQPGCEVAAIVQASGIDEASVRGIVERLKWRKLLDADHVAGDARHMRVSLTAAGRSLLDETVPHAHQITALTYGALDEGERATLVALLHKMNGSGG